ncbi:MAG: hypothetical protein ACOYCD_05765 [Kiritimatiellia bacterium]|jgi:hypothetical protein
MHFEFSADDAEAKRLVRYEFDIAEKALKRYERVGGVTLITAINQLRYAGRHIIDADADDITEKTRAEHYRKALNHCRRAAFDAREATAVYLLDKIQDFFEQSKTCDIDHITRFIPDYSDWLNKAAKAQKLLVTVGSLREVPDQTEIESAITDLLDFHSQIRVKWGSINSVQAKADRKERLETRRFIINFLLAVIGIIISIIIGIISL